MAPVAGYVTASLFASLSLSLAGQGETALGAGQDRTHCNRKQDVY